MRTMRVATALATLVAVVGLVACPVLGQQDGNVPADVSKIFDQKCASCHGGGSPAAGLDLATSAGVEKAIGEPSPEKPSTVLIVPGNPSSSYLVMKIEGSSGIVGGRMPLSGGNLSQGQVQTITSWISSLPASAGARARTGSQSTDQRSASRSSGESPELITADEMFYAPYTFQLHCAGCHGTYGQGITLFGVPLAGDPFIKASDDQAIGTVIQMGRKYQDKHYPAYPGMPRFQFITGGNLQSLVDYLKGPLQGGQSAPSR